MKELTCIVCPRGCRLRVDENHDFQVMGNGCRRGIEYGRQELLHPVRTVTSTVKVAGGLLPRCPVKTSAPVPREQIFEVMAALDTVVLQAPVEMGQTVIGGICGTEADLVTTRGILSVKSK